MNKKNVLEAINSAQYYLLVWVLFFVPLLFLPFFEDTFNFSKIIFFYFLATFLILTNAIKIFFREKFFLPSKLLNWAIFSFVLIFFLSSYFSIHPLSSFFGIYHTYIGSFVHLVALLIFSFSVFQIDWTKKIYQVSAYISAAAGIASIFALVQFTQYFYDFADFYRVRSTIGEPNRLSFFLSATLPFCIFLFLKSKQEWLRFVSFLNCLLVFVTILLTLSRSSWMAIFLTFVVLFLIFFWYLRRKALSVLKKFVKKNQLYLIVSLMLFAFFLPSLGTKVLGRNLAVIKDLKTGGGSINIRLQNWQVILKIIKNREKWYQHFFGTGPSTIVYTFLKNRSVSLNQNPIEKNWVTSTIRNQFLDLLTNVGILGLIAFVIIMATILFYVFKNLKKLAGSSIFWLAFACFLIIFFTSFFYYQTITTSIYFWFSLSGLTTLLRKQKIVIKKTYRFPVLTLGICLFSVCLFVLVKIASADLAFSKGNFEKATSLNPYNDFYQHQLAQLLLKQAEDEKNFQKAKLAIKSAEKAIKLNPISATNQYVLQLTNYRTGVIFNKKFHHQALEAGEKRIKLDPSHAGSYDTQGLVYLDLKELENALKYFKKAIEIDPDYLESYLHTGEALKQMGKIKEAIEYYKLALQKNPNWPFAQQELKKAQDLLDKSR